MHSKSIIVNISLKQHNNVKTARLEGFAYLNAGLLSGKISNKDHNFSISELTLITAFTYTGCPVAARTTDPESNPWITTGGRYEGTRLLTLGDTTAKSSITSSATENEIVMDLQVTTDGSLPTIKNIASPFQEHIFELETGKFKGTFELDFELEDGTLIPAFAESDYRLDVTEHFSSVWRNITILNSLSTTAFSQVEQIDMFTDSQTAKTDLCSKRSVFSTDNS